MSVMLISFDRGKMHQSAHQITGIIKRYNHIQLSDSTYAVENFEKTRTIYNKLGPYLGDNPHLYILTVIKPFSGPVLAPTSEWFSKYLPEE
jgi:hypothetical protein